MLRSGASVSPGAMTLPRPSPLLTGHTTRRHSPLGLHGLQSRLHTTAFLNANKLSSIFFLFFKEDTKLHVLIPKALFRGLRG